MAPRSFAIVSLSLAVLLAACGQRGMPGAAPLATGAPAASAVQLVPDELIVKYKPADATRYAFPGSRVLSQMSVETDDDTRLVQLPAGVTADAAMAAYRAHGVQFVEQHYLVAVHEATTSLVPDPLEARQWQISHLHLDQAWTVTTGSGSVVATVDTGADLSHPDLQGQLIPGPVYAGTGSLPVDGFGHGTHVAGIIAAMRGNGIGGVGVAPDAKVLVIKALDDQGQGGIFSVARGIVYAANWGASHHQHVIVNLSLGGAPGFDPIDWLAGWYAHSRGALLVAAAGNDHGPVGTPADLSDYLAVGATDQQDALASFSNFGPQIGLVAPGVDILSTMPTYHVAINDWGYPETAAELSGTSMAAPVVSGVAALVWAAHPDWTNDQVRARLEATAEHLGAAGRNDMYGYGLVDPVAALGLVEPSPSPAAQMLPFAPVPTPTGLVFRPN